MGIRERDRERYNRDPKESLNSLTKHTQRANDDIDGIIILRFTVLFFQRGFLEKKKFDDDDKQALEKRKTKCIRASGNHRNFPGLQELCKCEIPPHIGRVDFVKQMYRWADMTYTDGGLATFGKRMEISAINENQAGETNGYLISVFDFKDGEEQVVAELICQMDQTLIQTYDTILPPSKPGDIEGIKKMNRSGKDEFIEGEFFVISRKLPTDETVGSVLKVMIKRMMSAINAYYAFGSPFSEEF